MSSAVNGADRRCHRRLYKYEINIAMNRRELLQFAATLAAGAALKNTFALAQTMPATTEPSAAKLPQWRGFNLLEKFWPERKSAFLESDFELIAEWGFNFVRLPLSYQCWSKESKPREMNEAQLRDVDDAVKMGQARGIHININFHRIPGYCVNPPPESRSIWTDQSALDDAAWMWEQFAARYKGISNREVSFDLINEPPDVPLEQYVTVAKCLISAIRTQDPDRLIIADGWKWGTVPVNKLASTGIAQSTRGYWPFHLTHYRANWVKGSDKWPAPTWPMAFQNDPNSPVEVYDIDHFRRDQLAPWQKLKEQGVGVHVGEWGCHNQTPHDVTLAWMSDLLSAWKEANLGWALWNLRGNFGVLDSERKDVDYENFRGHKLDRKMLELLQRA
jgi:endoglucanase